MRRLSICGIIIALIVFFSGCGLPSSTQSSGSTATNSSSSTFGPEPNWGVQTKTTGCQADGGLQDKACTPGALLSNVTKDEICKSGYAGTARNVPQSEKNQVYDEYGIKTHSAGQYEVDHLVSLELGGSNDISNLWPELASPKPGFHEKDSVENYLHSEMCKGNIQLHEAQIEIATNWLAVYQRMTSSNATPDTTDQQQEQS